jgi:hypothetical protein
MHTPRLSGALIITQRKVMEKLVGAHVVKQALAKLPDEVRCEYEAMTPLTWFPALWFNEIVAAVAAEVKMDVLAFHAEVLSKSAELTILKLWGIFMRLTSDQALVSRTPILYSKSYTQGELTTKALGQGRAEITLRGWPGVPDIQIQALQIFIGTVLKVAGRKSPTVTAERRPTGAVFHATWRP